MDSEVKVKILKSDAKINTFLVRFFGEAKEIIVVDKLNEEDKETYDKCCKLYEEYLESCE